MAKEHEPVTALDELLRLLEVAFPKTQPVHQDETAPLPLKESDKVPELTRRGVACDEDAWLVPLRSTP